MVFYEIKIRIDNVTWRCAGTERNLTSSSSMTGQPR